MYALGVILYELLANCRPHDLSDRTPAEVEAIVPSADPTPSLAGERAPAGRRRAAWADLDVLCLTAMHKDPHGATDRRGAGSRLDHFLTGSRWRRGPTRSAIGPGSSCCGDGGR